MSTFDRQQAISKINEFRDKITSQMQAIITNKQELKKPFQYFIYEPKRIDISTQTVYDRSTSKNKSINSKQQTEMNDMRKQKRLTELKEIVQDSFKQYFRTAKNKENQLNLKIEHLQNEKEHLYREIQRKDVQIGELKVNLEKITQSSKNPINELKESTKLWEQQHEKDTNHIKNLQKGIAEYKKETERLTMEMNKYENDLIFNQKRIKQLQILYKNSQHLVDAMSKQETKIFSKLQTLQIEINRKTQYIEYIENLYLDGLRRANVLDMEIQYFRAETQTVRWELEKINEELSFSQSEKNLYQKLNESLLEELKIQNLKSSLKYIKTQQNSQYQENPNAEPIDSIEKLIECFQNEQDHYNLVFEVQNIIFNEELLLQTCRFNIQHEEKQQNMSNIFKASLKQAIMKEKDSYSSFSQNSHKDQEISKFFINDSSNLSQSSDGNQGFQSQKDLNSKNQNVQHLQSQKQPPGSHYQSKQSSHKQNQTNQLLPDIQVNLQHKISLAQRLSSYENQKKHENGQVDKNLNLLSPQKKTFHRPPSFGNQNGVDILSSEFDKQAFQTETPHFTQIQSNQSQVRSDGPQGFHLTQSQHHAVQHLSNFATSCLKKKQIVRQNVIQKVEDVRILKDLKGSESIIQVEKQKFSDQMALTQTIKIQRNDRKSLPEIRTNIEIPLSKEAYCQATVQENCPDSREKEKEPIKFMKKHESMINYIVSHPLSPSHQKEQSDCHLMIEKIKKHPKKKIDFKLPHKENEKIKKNLKDLQRELFQNIQAHNSMWRKLDRDKFNRILGCPKLSQRLAELIQKQTSIEQQIIINGHNHPTQVSSSLPANKGDQKQADGSKHDKFLINQELQVMIELQKLIRDTYEWILLVQRLNKREYDKHERLVARIRLKKTKTNIHHPFKEKQSNEDKNETDSLTDLYKEKSVFSEGDSPRIVGDADHFDISPYEHNQVPQKYEDIRSFEKLFKQGQQISEISSVKNQSQVSSFINARSEFANILYSKNFIKVQDEAVHPSLAPAYYESIQNNPQTQIHLNSANHAHKHKQHVTSPQNPHHHEQLNSQNKYDAKSIKSVRHLSSQQKDRIKSLQKRNAEISSYYKKIIEKMKEDENKRYLKIQKDFNKALTMALKLKSVHFTNASSTQKEVETAHQASSIKNLQNNEIKNSLSQIKSLTSRLQSKSLTQITLLSQKISQKDEILEQKIESYEKNIDELKMKNQEIRVSLTTKIQLIEDMQKKLKLQKFQTQKVEKKSEQLRKEIQLLKTQNKKIKNEFSQFMTKLVTSQKERTANLIKRLESSGNENQNESVQIHLKAPELIKYAESLLFTSDRIQPISRGKQNLPIIQQNHQNEFEKQKVNKILSQTKMEMEKIDFGLQTQDIRQQKSVNPYVLGQTKEINQKQSEILSKSNEIESLKQQLKEKSVQMESLNDQVTKLSQQNCDLTQQIDMLTIQISQKAVEISELTNSLRSIQTFEKRLQEKLSQAQDKIKDYEIKNQRFDELKNHQTPMKKIRSNQKDQEQRNFKSPISMLNNQQVKEGKKSQVRRKKSQDSLGSMEQKFFDLQSEKEFNNIEPSKESQKNSKIRELQRMLNETTKKLQELNVQKNKK